MKITIVSPPFLKGYMRNARCDFVSISNTQWYPILPAYLGAFLESKKHHVQFIDAPACSLSRQETLDMIQKFSPEWIIIYSGRLSQDSDAGFGKSLSETLDCSIVYAGPYVGIEPDVLARKVPFAKGVIAGEMEKPVERLINGESRDHVPGLYYLEGELVKTNPQGPYLSSKELDDIPFVSKFYREHLDIRKYRTLAEPYPFLDILTGRGCVYGQCTYCLWVNTFVKGATYNQRSMENVVEEVKYIKSSFPEVRSIMLQDDTFPEKRAVEFSEKLLEQDIKIRWSCYARGNLSYDAMKTMKRAGLLNMHVGFESANQDVLKTVKKGISVERMTRFMKDVHKLDLQVHADFAFGFHGETKESIEDTIRWAEKLQPETCQFQLIIPFKGTPMYDEMKEKGYLNENGEPEFPWLSNEELRNYAKKAYRKNYLNLHYFKKMLRHPGKYFFGRLKLYTRAIPALFWKKWEV